jgi:hypothetical protein
MTSTQARGFHPLSGHSCGTVVGAVIEMPSREGFMRLVNTSAAYGTDMAG